MWESVPQSIFFMKSQKKRNFLGSGLPRHLRALARNDKFFRQYEKSRNSSVPALNYKWGTFFVLFLRKVLGETP